MMITICLFARERVIEKERVQNDGAEESYTLRDMVECLRRNKYLLLFFAAPLISSLLNVGANWGLYVARYCLGGEEAASYVSMAVIIPTLIGAFMAVELCKKYDKFKVFYISYVFALLLGIVRFIAGYENMMVYVILNALGGIPLGIAVILQYQFTPDCYEYGQYKTGLKMRGVTFAAQTFFTKLLIIFVPSAVWSTSGWNWIAYSFSASFSAAATGQSAVCAEISNPGAIFEI